MNLLRLIDLRSPMLTHLRLLKRIDLSLQTLIDSNLLRLIDLRSPMLTHLRLLKRIGWSLQMLIDLSSLTLIGSNLLRLIG